MIQTILALVVILIPALINDTWAGGFADILSRAMIELDVKQNDTDLLLLTNIPYIKINGQTPLDLLDQAQQISGCTVGRGNLLFFQRPQNHPLRLMLFRKTDGRAVIISRMGHTWTTEALILDQAAVSSHKFWKTAKISYKAGSDIPTLAGIANVWASGGPYDFLKAAELHNHICPGLTSGYLIARYILDHYPMKKEEQYTVIASPVWCKEDALQVILDCTPGKKRLIVKPLSKAQTKKISVAEPAAILLVWDEKNKTGKGMALSFSFDTLKALCPKDSPKLTMVLSALPYLNDPDRFVSTAAVFDLDEALYNNLKQAGSNPYEIAGLIKK